ncbi:hypothetical protein GN956_G4898 [Arapaima gigas]
MREGGGKTPHSRGPSFQRRTANAASSGTSQPLACDLDQGSEIMNISGNPEETKQQGGGGSEPIPEAKREELLRKTENHTENQTTVKNTSKVTNGRSRVSSKLFRVRNIVASTA